MGEVFLSAFEARVLPWEVKLLTVNEKGFTLISAGVDVFDGRMHVNSTDYFGLKGRSLQLDLLDFDFSKSKVALFDVQATALTVGMYSEHFDTELLVGSVGATAKWDNGKLTLGLSWGIGIKITIKFW